MIVLDIDGVVANFFDELDYALRQSGFGSRESVSPEELSRFMTHPLVAKNAKPFEDAWYWVNHYSDKYDLMYLTSRDDSLSRLTWDWFFDWDMPADFVVFQRQKVEFLQQIQVSVYVDDNPNIINAALEVGVNAYLINRDYNVNYHVESDRRINYLWEIKCV